MRTLLRAIILLLVVLWLGGVMFFPIVAASAFGTTNDTHLAGTIVRKCLLALHYEGLIAGALIVILLLVAQAFGAFRRVAAAVVVTLIMLGLTALSQFWIIPKMEGYRIAAGGVIDVPSRNDPNTAAFNNLHAVSVRVEEGVLLGGLVLVVLLAANWQAGETQLSRTV
ncbi:MAG: DUF4149 domain-containing protein [Silvibacterium sp.]|nr:DUF4149 domain-containing protein [Silvibacterium sp.]